MKKLVPFMIIICIIVLIVVIVMMMSDVATMLTSQEEKLSQMQNQVNYLENQIAEPKIENTVPEPVVEKESTNTPPFAMEKLKVAVPDATYEIADEAIVTPLKNCGITIEIEEGKVYLSTDATNTQYQTLFPNITEVKKQEITGFTAKPKSFQYAVFGQNINPPVILFLMEDGTLEYVKSLEMLQSATYGSKGKIGELANIVDFDYVSVHENAGGSFISTVAIDKEGFYYDLHELIENI